MPNPKNILFSGEIFIKTDDIVDEKLDCSLDVINEELRKINDELDGLIAHNDIADYIVAASSGLISGIFDSVFVGEFNFEEANIIGQDKIVNLVIKVANYTGCKSHNLEKCIKHLEAYNIPGDKVYKNFGGGLQHHLREFSHHVSPVGLFFSILTQFTGNVYGADKNGKFISISLPDVNTDLIGSSIIEKINKGVIDWFFHLASDMAGSSGTINKGGLPTGLPGPLLSLLKELSSLRIFQNNNSDEVSKFSLLISKLYNGTLLAERNIDGKIVKPIQFNFQTEYGILTYLEKQMIPVVINEVIVRAVYLFRRLIGELKDKNVSSFSDIKNINWEAIAPYNNHTIDRMLTVSLLAFSLYDTADALVRGVLEAKGDIVILSIKFAARYNYIGAGRAAFAVYKEFEYENNTIETLCKKRKLSEEKTKLVLEKINKFNAELDKLMCEYVLEDVTIFIEGLNNIDSGIKNNDSNLVIKGNVIIQNKLGVKEKFSSQEEFDKLMHQNSFYIL